MGEFVYEDGDTIPLMLHNVTVGQAKARADGVMECSVLPEYLEELKAFMGPGDGQYIFKFRPKENFRPGVLDGPATIRIEESQ